MMTYDQKVLPITWGLFQKRYPIIKLITLVWKLFIENSINSSRHQWVNQHPLVFVGACKEHECKRPDMPSHRPADAWQSMVAKDWYIIGLILSWDSFQQIDTPDLTLLCHLDNNSSIEWMFADRADLTNQWIRIIDQIVRGVVHVLDTLKENEIHRSPSCRKVCRSADPWV